MLVEGHGRPLAACISGANTPDSKLLKATLDAVVVVRPVPTEQKPQHLCLDKGYAGAPAEAIVREAGYVPHVRRIGEEKLDEQREKTYPARRWREKTYPARRWREKTYPARRWVVERTFAWLSRCRALLVRYDRRADRYLALIKLASGLLWTWP